MLLKTFCKIEKEGMLPNLFSEVSITWIAKPDKDDKKKTNLPININTNKQKTYYLQSNSRVHQKRSSP